MQYRTPYTAADPTALVENVIAKAAKQPGVRINRDKYLKSALGKHFDKDTIAKAIATSPAQAGIHPDKLRQIASDAIQAEATRATALSAAAGIPGGIALVGTIPADAVQYFAHILRAAQKLAYLYSWETFLDDRDANLDEATRKTLLLFVGVMIGVQEAENAIFKLSSRLATSVSERIAAQSAAQGIIFPVAKKVASVLGTELSKEAFGKAVGKTIPFVGAAVSGGLTYATFKPMCERLRDHLASLEIANPENFVPHIIYGEIIAVETLEVPGA